MNDKPSSLLPQSESFGTLQGVSRTLLIPLYARGFAAKLLPKLSFQDNYAKQLVESAALPMSEVSRDRFPMRLCIARTFVLDRALSTLLSTDSPRNVVLFACGLDTMPLRLQQYSSRWICGDLEPVMELRETLLPEASDRKHQVLRLPQDIDSLASVLHTSRPVLVLEGILPYLPPEDVEQCFQSLAELCPLGADILVDSYHPHLLSFAEMGATFKRMKTGFKFGLKHPRLYENFGPSIRYVEHWDLLRLMPWYVRKRCWLPWLSAGGGPLATITRLEVVPSA